MLVPHPREQFRQMTRRMNPKRLPRYCRLIACAALMMLAVATTSPLNGDANQPVWSTIISVTCSGVTDGYHGNVAGNLDNHQGNKNSALELNGTKGFVFWGVPCGNTVAFTTRKEPDNAVVSFQTVNNETGAVDCNTSEAIPTLPAEVIHLKSGADICTSSSYTSITVNIGTPTKQ